MNKDYLQPVPIKDIKLHGDFACETPTVTVLRVNNLRVGHWPPCCICTDNDAFKEETGYDHTAQLCIRSTINIFKNYLEYDVAEVSWINENKACRQAIEENELLTEFGMTFCYDSGLGGILEYSETHHYEFDLPDEMLLVIPVDLNASEYDCLDPATKAKFIDHLAYKQMLTTLPITNIREVPNVSEAEDPEVTKLDAIKDFVEATMDEMFLKMEQDVNMDDTPYVVSINLNGQTFELGCCAKEYNGLLEYIEYMKSEI